MSPCNHTAADSCLHGDECAQCMREEIARLCEALGFYANPESYHAISFLGDSPCGAFADDFSKDHGHPHYSRSMPGKLARQALGEQPVNKPE